MADLLDKLTELESALKHQPGKHPQSRHAGATAGGGADGLDAKLEAIGSAHAQRVMGDLGVTDAMVDSNYYQDELHRIDMRVPVAGTSHTKLTRELRGNGYRTVSRRDDYTTLRNKAAGTEITVSKWPSGTGSGQEPAYSVEAYVREKLDLDELAQS